MRCGALPAILSLVRKRMAALLGSGTMSAGSHVSAAPQQQHDERSVTPAGVRQQGAYFAESHGQVHARQQV